MLKSKIIFLNVTRLCYSPYHRFAQASGSNFGQNYYQILGVSPNANLDQIKTAYRELSKKYHPDVSKDPHSVEMFKKIGNAYAALKDEKSRSRYDEENPQNYDQRSGSTYQYNSGKSQSYSGESSEQANQKASSQRRGSDVKSKEELLYESIFGKSFKEDPTFYYKAENAELRSTYQEAIKRMHEENGTGPKTEYRPEPDFESKEEAYNKEFNDFMNNIGTKGKYNRQEQNQSYEAHNKEGLKRSPLSNLGKGVLAVGAGALLYLLTFERGRNMDKYEVAKTDLKSEEIESLRGKHLAKREEAKEKKKVDFINSLALMKKYPRKNPTATNMLIDYTLWNDVKFYTVNGFYFHGLDQEKTLNTKDFERSRIYNTRMNTKLTLALEAERVYKNVFVKVDDVLESLKKNGYYQAPGVFFRYYGFIYTQIRRKPIVAEHLQEAIAHQEKHISLYDLFFRYSTPILMANDEYYEIPLHHTSYIKDTTTREGKSWLGNAHINFRPIEKKFIESNDRNVFLWTGPEHMTHDQNNYLHAWGAHYLKYNKI